MPKQKKNSGGRPKKPKDEQQVQVNDSNYLQVNELAFKIIELIGILANYKILTITGPKGVKNNDEKNERRKNVEDKQRQIRNVANIQEEYVFFLKDIENTQRKYRLVNNKIEVEFQDILTQQQQEVIEQINHRSQGNIFFGSVEMAFQHLNPHMQMVLKTIIESYEESDKNQTSFEEKFFQKLKANPEFFTELFQWDSLFEEGFEEKILIQEDELKQFQTKFSKKGSESKKEQKESKVELKRQQVINAETESITNMKKLQKPHRPIKYLLLQLFALLSKGFPLLSQGYQMEDMV